MGVTPRRACVRYWFISAAVAATGSACARPAATTLSNVRRDVLDESTQQVGIGRSEQDEGAETVPRRETR